MIVGVTGHQNLGDATAVEWVRDTLAIRVSQHPVSRGLSSLAIGADQLFVEGLQLAHIPYEVVIPCEGYETTFADEVARGRYERLLHAAAKVHQLPFDSPSEEAFFAAGRWIVAHCDLLIAVWNGLPARGLGGTADVVAVARAERRPWMHINPTTRVVEEHSMAPRTGEQ